MATTIITPKGIIATTGTDRNRIRLHQSNNWLTTLTKTERGASMKIKTIKIKSVEQSLKEAVHAYNDTAHRRPVKLQHETFFASIAAARRVLTPSRITLLRTIKQQKPESIYELAKLIQRDFKNVSQDIVFLSALGLVDLEKPHGVRHQRKPVLLSNHICLDIAI